MSQWSLVGPAYQAAAIGQDNELCINWFPEVSANQPGQGSALSASKTVSALLGVPGLQTLTSAFIGTVRGMCTLPGSRSAIIVVGSTVVFARVTGNTPNKYPIFTFTNVGSLTTTSEPVGIRSNGAGNIVVISDGSPTMGVYNSQFGTFHQQTDASYTGSYTVAEIDGWFIFNINGTQKFIVSPNYWNGTSAFDGTYFALKDNSADNLVTVVETNRELWLLGECTTEPWFNAGGATFPFSRINGAMIQIGCASAYSVAKTGKGLIWLARSERGENSVVTTQGYQYTVVSTPAISYALNQFPVVADAIGYTYTEEGHEFYVLTFPTADVTYVYDLTTQLWHQRASFDPTTGQFHRQRASCCTNIAGIRMAGDFQSGKIYQQSRQFFQEGITPLVGVRRSPHVWDAKDRNRVTHSRLQVEFLAGKGLQTLQGSDPQAMLRWSNDSGQTWGAEHWRSMGKAGQTKRRTIWRRLGSARDRVYELRVSDPVSRDIVGASLELSETGS